MLSSKQRAFLKKEAHNLSPIVRIGKEGLTDNISSNLLNALNVKEVVKVKVLQNLDANKDIVKEFGEKLSKDTNSDLVAIIGRILIFYKENQEKPVVSDRVKSIK